MKRRRKVTLPDGSTGCQEIDLRKKLNLSYLRYTNMLGGDMWICCLLDIRSERPARRPHGRAAGREALYSTTLSTQSTSAS
ncbi:hypothetical protein [Olsenella urininfantis]|uniref:hypothetical protein n=1 Tax=Olsenella urininfantis TaxID=1871033 RepID=UPI00190E8812|nr:hypothetical protein [Olsenella urininfantis]